MQIFPASVESDEKSLTEKLSNYASGLFYVEKRCQFKDPLWFPS